MPKPLRVIAANDTFGALVALGRVVKGEEAIFVSQAEINAVKPKVFDLPETVDDHVGLIVETSGSTGTPKRIQISVQALLASAWASSDAIGASSSGDSQWLLTLPTNYIAGLQVLVRSLVAETQPVMMNTQLPFTSEAFVRAASQMTGERRFTSLVPTQLMRLSRHHDINEIVKCLQSFDAILLGGQQPDMALVEGLRSRGINIVVTYGMTETCGGCVYDGQAIGDARFRINDAGIIEIAGPMLAEGVGVTDALGTWFKTSDLGAIEPDGTLHVIGRADRVIVSGGLKVSLDAVETELASIGGVFEVVAVATDSVEWGQRVAVMYVGSPEVAEYIAGDALVKLGPAAKPVRVMRVDSIPKLPAGKPDYQTIKQIFES